MVYHWTRRHLASAQRVPGSVEIPVEHMAAVTTSAPELAPDVAAAAAATSARMAEAWRKAATYAPEAVFAVRAFAEVLRADTTAPFEDDAGYMFFKEAQFCINVLLRQADSQAEEQLVRGQPAPRGAAWQGAAVAGDAPDSEFKVRHGAKNTATARAPALHLPRHR